MLSQVGTRDHTAAASDASSMSRCQSQNCASEKAVFSAPGIEAKAIPVGFSDDTTGA